MPKVWNKRDPKVPKDAVYVGRPTKWGNPFKIGDPHPLHGPKQDGSTAMDRGEVVDLFRYYAHEQPGFSEMIKAELKGKDLVCWCAPEACHADVLLEVANVD